MSEPYTHVPFDAQGRKRDWFCEDVLTGKAPIQRVFEDDLVLAFHHPRPIAAKHVVIIPKATSRRSSVLRRATRSCLSR